MNKSINPNFDKIQNSNCNKTKKSNYDNSISDKTFKDF